MSSTPPSARPSRPPVAPVRTTTREIHGRTRSDDYEWLRERLYRHGRKFTPSETILRVAGGPINPEPYLRYLADKNASLAPA